MNKVEEGILNSLKKNGFPEKKVTLPFQAIFNSCKKNDVKLSDVLNSLKQQDIMSEIGNDKILFTSPEQTDSREADSDFENSSVFKAAMDKIKDMDPKQVQELKEKVMNMSAEERAGLMSKAKDFFKK